MTEPPTLQPRNAESDISTMSRHARHALLLSPTVQIQIMDGDTVRPVRKIPCAVLTAFSPQTKKHYETQTCDPRITGAYIKLDAIAAIIDWMIESCDSLNIDPIHTRARLGGNIELYMAAKVLDIPLVKEHIGRHIATLARDEPYIFLDPRVRILGALPADDLLVQMVSKGFADGYGEDWMERRDIKKLITRFPLVTGELQRAMPTKLIQLGFVGERVVFLMFLIMAWGPMLWFLYGIWIQSLDDP
ncbi:uncharacterized protein BDZ99DRAFT_523762 [Mytilinidion resinicola]|uniref:Uncharacterized protein n=1 Tax=Mytilinidion resinicola TaxID=574789 RepID=A0A6A6YCR1_9PEZI|nr:uncharacterized protein BDZ99DRAFT_523762 [Mytilinidion resinicola]KAF2806303.1 hypothetical protein BDZ99DRAFT_523762 [Mytilinidion resinicola]